MEPAETKIVFTAYLTVTKKGYETAFGFYFYIEELDSRFYTLERSPFSLGDRVKITIEKATE